MTSSSLQQVDVFIPVIHLDGFLSLVEEGSLSLSWQLEDHDTRVHIQVIYPATHALNTLDAHLSVAMKALPDAAAAFTIKQIPSLNWLEHYATATPAQRIGRFYIYGTHLKHASRPLNTLPLWIDAATAFGSGEHATTAGCLLALEDLARHFKPKKVLDLGCGTGILGIGAAKLWPSTLLVASDIDPEAIRVTRLNATRNQVKPRICVANGLGHPLLHQQAPYDVVVANILARPLCELAHDIKRSMKQGAFLILSGLLQTQTRLVLNRYIQQGFAYIKGYPSREWITLLLRLERNK